MSNLSRWEPMREMLTLREAMNQLFDDSFTRPFGISAVSGSPAVEMYEENDQVVVKAALPGLKADDVQISVTADQLTIHGEFKSQNEPKNATYHLREYHYGSFERTLHLPTEVQSDNSRADFENGVLTIVLPKAEAVKPRSISIKVK
jgi:HSP20 family protein